MKICIVILNYKNYEETIRVVDDLNKIKDTGDFKIVVVDNASPNESNSILANKFRKTDVTYFHSDNNGGFAKGNNIGLDYSLKNNYDATLIMNNDIYFDNCKNFISKMASLLKDNVVGVSPKMVDPKGELFFFDLDRFSLKDKFNKKYHSELVKRSAELVSSNKPFRIYRPFGACMLLSNKFLAETNLLDERTFLYWEEPILGEKAYRRNEVFMCNPEAVVMHLEGASISLDYASQKRKNKIGYKSVKYYMEYRYGFFAPLMSFIFITGSKIKNLRRK